MDNRAGLMPAQPPQPFRQIQFMWKPLLSHYILTSIPQAGRKWQPLARTRGERAFPRRVSCGKAHKNPDDELISQASFDIINKNDTDRKMLL
jgi:hypothetical protein